jgi:Fic family protein
MLTDIMNSLEQKKQQLDRLHTRGGLANLEHSHDLELTYTSNAIEGNTLNAAETTLVVEQGITIGGKPLKDHLEAIDHFEAIRYVRELARRTVPLAEMDVRTLHGLVVQRSRPGIAGRYADQGRYVLTEGGRHSSPSPAEVPALMGDYARWLARAPNTPQAAFDAHRRLVDVHPFDGGNGRTARLLMNLILIRGGYPPVAVRPEDRPAYVAALQEARSAAGAEAFDRLLYRRLDATFEYLRAAQDALPQPAGPTPCPD